MGELWGKRILVVEDDWVVADEIVRALARAGAEVVGPAPSLDLCLSLIGSGAMLDAAVLDINLRGVPVYPAVDALKARGVPFVFLTGYDGDAIPDDYAQIRRFEKPVDPRRVIAGLLGRPDRL